VVNCGFIERIEKTDVGYVVLKEAGRLPINNRAKEQLNYVFRTIA
jgi:hypothetical protein